MKSRTLPSVFSFVMSVALFSGGPVLTGCGDDDGGNNNTQPDAGQQPDADLDDDADVRVPGGISPPEETRLGGAPPPTEFPPDPFKPPPPDLTDPYKPPQPPPDVRTAGVPRPAHFE